MSDNFDLKKFLKESKAIENLNPFLAESYSEFEREDKGNKGVTAKDKAEEEVYGAGVAAGKRDAMKAKIKEYILAELELDVDDSDKSDAELNADYDPVYEGKDEEDEDYSDYFFDVDTEEDLEEAKKKKNKEDVEDVEDVEVTDTEIEDVPADDAELDMGMENSAEASLSGDEKDIMNNLMKALEISKQLGNEKVITQISNTLKFFISEYVAN